MRVSLMMASTPALLLGAVVVIQGSRRSDERKTSPERETAELLDALIQPRFQVTNGKDFGMSRVVPKIAYLVQSKSPLPLR